MTTHYDGGHVYLECEDCTETTDHYGPDYFDALVADAKAAGWSIYLNGNRWEHKCPGCKAGDRLARAQKMFGS